MRFVRRLQLEASGFRWLAVALAVVFVELGYVYIASAGKFTGWPTYGSRVDELAEAFGAGQLHLLFEPPSALLSAKNPFDAANFPLWYWDASLYRDHYYQYWGPVPSLLLALVKTGFRIDEPLGDEYPTFALATLQLCAGAVLIERAARRLFAKTPSILVALAVLAFGLANPTPFILARQNVYEAAIIGGHAFLLTGIALAFEAVWSADVTRRSLAFAFGAGVAWALALGCRVSLAPAMPFLVLTTGLAMARGRDGRWKRSFKSLAATGMPLAVGVGALLAYNKARFEHWFEFGQRFQLTWIEVHVSSSFIGANAYSYAFRPVQISCKFPFVVSTIGIDPTLVFPEWFTLPEGYLVYEQVAGVFVTTPWAWFSVVALAMLGIGAWRALRTRRAASRVSVATIWALGTLLFASSLGILVPLCVSTATMRYLGDVVGALMVFASLGAFATYAALRRVAVVRWLALIVLSGASLASVAVGLAFGIGGYYQHFQLNNPELLDRLEKRYSTCAKSAP